MKNRRGHREKHHDIHRHSPDPLKLPILNDPLLSRDELLDRCQKRVGSERHD